MAIKFIIDSASDVLPSEAEKLGVTHIPLKVIFGEDEYLDAINLSHREFYEKLVETDTLSTTCQIPPADFMSAYEHLTANGDEVIVITLSSELSGTYQSAVMAAEGYEGKVYVVDSRSVCIGERILLLRGIALNKQGLSAEEIVSELTAEKNQTRVLPLLDTLEYLKKGGRISAATALAGGILSIKPVIAVNDGKVELVGKARGSKKGNNLLRELVEKCGGINFDKPLALAYSGLTDELLKKYIKDSEELWQGHTDELQITTVGCTIGTHVGPGAVAVAFFEK